jgi:hypothetical protein
MRTASNSLLRPQCRFVRDEGCCSELASFSTTRNVCEQCMCIPDVCCIPRRLVRFRLWTSFVIGTLDSRTKRHRGYRAGSENKCLDRATSARPEASSSVQVRRRVMPPNCKFNEIQPTVRANSSTKGTHVHARVHAHYKRP